MTKRLELEPFFVTGLSSIQQTDVLSDSDINDLKSFLDEMRQVYDTNTIWRTHTEAVCSVLDDVRHPTKASKYHQAKLEQGVMFDNLIMLSFSYREKLLDLKEIEQKLVSAKGIGRERLEIKRARCVYELDSMRRKAKDRFREIRMWSEIKQELDDGTFDRDDKNTDQLLALTLRYCQELPTAYRSKETAGANNIIGQCVTLLKECRRLGIQNQLGDIGKQAEKMLRAEKLLEF